MMLEAALFENHLTLSHAFLRSYIAQLADCGIEVSDALTLQSTDRIYAYYDMTLQAIFINLIDPQDPLWKLKAHGLMALLGFTNHEEFIDYWSLQVQYTVAHELGHHLRHHYGLASRQNLWNEEQIANRFASGMTKSHFTAVEKERFCCYIRRAFESLAPKIGARNDALNIYGHIHYALHTLGLIDDKTLAAIDHAVKYDRCDAGAALATYSNLSPEVMQLIAPREPLIAAFNQEYIANPVRYTYYHLAWTFYELSSVETFDLAELAGQSLGKS